MVELTQFEEDFLEDFEKEFPNFEELSESELIEEMENYMLEIMKKAKKAKHKMLIAS